MNNTQEYIENNKQRFLDELFELLKIPSISAQKEHDVDIKNAAEWLKKHLIKIGLENAKVMPTKGHPVVYADWLHAKGKPTIIIYGHYDVQSPDPLKEWKSKPFEPEIRNGNIYARGTADDKGQLFMHLKALEMLIKTEGTLEVNVKFLIEGEEEIGGVNLDDFILEHKDLLMADICLISDSHSYSPSQPLVVYGLRGLVYTEIELSTMPKDVHSGEFGGNIPNPAIELANIISMLKDKNTQRILIPGFYDNVRKLSEKEKSELAEGYFNEAAVSKESGVKKILGLKNAGVAVRAGALPTLDVNGMKSGYIDEGAKTIIPSKASAKISMRIVPNQKSEEIAEKFKSYLEKIVPDYVDYNVKVLSTGEPIIMQKDSDFFSKANDVLQKHFGNQPAYELLGGSIPVTAVFKNILGIDSVLMGFGLPDDGLHSPNEKISTEMFYKGIKCLADYYKSF